MMTSLVRRLLCAAAAAAMRGSRARAQLLGVPVLPPVGLPLPTSNFPVAGPLLQNILAQPGAQQAISPTLDTVAGVPEAIANSGAPNLLQLRRLRLDQLIRTNRATVENDGNGLPVRRGIVAVLNPDPAGLQRAVSAGFRVASDQVDPQLGIRTLYLAVPARMSAKAALRLLQKIAPELQADFDHLFEPAGGSLAPVAGALAATTSIGGVRSIGMIDGGVA